MHHHHTVDVYPARDSPDPGIKRRHYRRRRDEKVKTSFTTALPRRQGCIIGTCNAAAGHESLQAQCVLGVLRLGPGIVLCRDLHGLSDLGLPGGRGVGEKGGGAQQQKYIRLCGVAKTCCWLDTVC